MRLPIIEHALEAGADPNFSFHGNPYEEAPIGTPANVSLSEPSVQNIGPDHNRRYQWEKDAESWVRVVRIFLQHGGSPVATSSQYVG